MFFSKEYLETISEAFFEKYTRKYKKLPPESVTNKGGTPKAKEVQGNPCPTNKKLSEGLIEKYKEKYKKGQVEAAEAVITVFTDRKKKCKDDVCRAKAQKEIDKAKEALANMKKKGWVYPVGGYRAQG